MKVPKISVETLPVSTLEDLANLVSKNVDAFAEGINCLGKQIKRMKGKLGILTLGFVAYAVYNEYQHQKMDEQIYNLQVRVKKLENKENSEEE